ncbi:MAG TPA: LysM peptidoglycan-binding domain-containing protein, partial [Gammaproteobacteria bacterium]|nr:LysM peptidoglycan-binding domain-containing protein [Gammaproteobacteria bacterium]
MSRGDCAVAVRVAVVFAVAILSAAAARAQSSESLFPRPAALEPAVAFWTRVYTEVDTDSGFIHDSLRLDIVYQTVSVSSDLSSRERRRRIERSMATYHSILTKLGAGARTNLSAEEHRVLDLFPKDTNNREFKSAAERLRFQLGQSDRFRAGLIRSGAWKPYIYEVLEERGLPRELAALPHVESSFDPTAYSKVGAAGMWQFMRSTGMRYMRIDQVIDERRDPFFATDAAARLLEDNHSVLQSWPLALTAYNHGVAGMRRAVEQQKTTDIEVIVRKYQSRSFGFASRNFYTAFLAALEIDTHPAKYFGDITLDPPSPTAVVAVPDYVTANTLADALNVRERVLRDLNPALTDSVWSGDKFVPKGFELRLPLATAAVAEDLLATVGVSERYAAQRPDLEHRVRRGDTLSHIAAEYRVSLAALMRVNGLSSRSVIRIGQTISLPGGADGVPPTAAALARVVTPQTVTPAVPQTAERGSYVVRRGDSIERIATTLGIDPRELLAANSIRNKNLIYAGQTLRIPDAESAGPVPVLAAEAGVAEAALAEAAVSDAGLVAAAQAAQTPGEPVGQEEIVATVESGALLDATERGPSDAVTGLEATTEVNALSIVQADLAADPSDYSVSAGDVIQVQALETLGHYADWLGIPTQRLRDLNRISFREAVVIGRKLTLDFSRVDAASFEQRRIAYQQQQQGA